MLHQSTIGSLNSTSEKNKEGSNVTSQEIRNKINETLQNIEYNITYGFRNKENIQHDIINRPEKGNTKALRRSMSTPNVHRKQLEILKASKDNCSEFRRMIDSAGGAGSILEAVISGKKSRRAKEMTGDRFGQGKSSIEDSNQKDNNNLDIQQKMRSWSCYDTEIVPSKSADGEIKNQMNFPPHHELDGLKPLERVSLKVLMAKRQLNLEGDIQSIGDMETRFKRIDTCCKLPVPSKPLRILNHSSSSVNRPPQTPADKPPTRSEHPSQFAHNMIMVPMGREPSLLQIPSVVSTVDIPSVRAKLIGMVYGAGANFLCDLWRKTSLQQRAQFVLRKDTLAELERNGTPFMESANFPSYNKTPNALRCNTPYEREKQVCAHVADRNWKQAQAWRNRRKLRARKRAFQEEMEYVEELEKLELELAHVAARQGESYGMLLHQMFPQVFVQKPSDSSRKFSNNFNERSSSKTEIINNGESHINSNITQKISSTINGAHSNSVNHTATIQILPLIEQASKQNSIENGSQRPTNLRSNSASNLKISPETTTASPRLLNHSKTSIAVTNIGKSRDALQISLSKPKLTFENSLSSSPRRERVSTEAAPSSPTHRFENPLLAAHKIGKEELIQARKNILQAKPLNLIMELSNFSADGLKSDRNHSMESESLDDTSSPRNKNIYKPLNTFEQPNATNTNSLSSNSKVITSLMEARSSLTPKADPLTSSPVFDSNLQLKTHNLKIPASPESAIRLVGIISRRDMDDESTIVNRQLVVGDNLVDAPWMRSQSWMQILNVVGYTHRAAQATILRKREFLLKRMRIVSSSNSAINQGNIINSSAKPTTSEKNSNSKVDKNNIPVISSSNTDHYNNPPGSRDISSNVETLSPSRNASNRDEVEFSSIEPSDPRSADRPKSALELWAIVKSCTRWIFVMKLVRERNNSAAIIRLFLVKLKTLIKIRENRKRCLQLIDSTRRTLNAWRQRRNATVSIWVSKLQILEISNLFRFSVLQRPSSYNIHPHVRAIADSYSSLLQTSPNSNLSLIKLSANALSLEAILRRPLLPAPSEHSKLYPLYQFVLAATKSPHPVETLLSSVLIPVKVLTAHAENLWGGRCRQFKHLQQQYVLELQDHANHLQALKAFGNNLQIPIDLPIPPSQPNFPWRPPAFQIMHLLTFLKDKNRLPHDIHLPNTGNHGEVSFDILDVLQLCDCSPPAQTKNSNLLAPHNAAEQNHMNNFNSLSFYDASHSINNQSSDYTASRTLNTPLGTNAAKSFKREVKLIGK